MHLYLYVYGHEHKFQIPFYNDSQVFLVFLQPTLAVPAGQTIESAKGQIIKDLCAKGTGGKPGH